MFCYKCGRELKDGTKFCLACGTDLRIVSDYKDKNDDISQNNENVSGTKDNCKRIKLKPLLIIACVCFFSALVVITSLMIMKSESERRIQDKLSLAARYLSELDYDRAIAIYQSVIDIDAMREEAYLGIATAYVDKIDIQKAIDYLMEGYEMTESDVISKRLKELEEKLDKENTEELIPTIEPEPEGIGETNWRGGDWTNRDDILPSMNDEEYIVFGAYEQDGDESNGPEPIEWVVLDKNEKGTLLTSRYVLDAQAYHSEFVDVTWENCTLRRWLNTIFLNRAFTGAEQEKISITNVTNSDNPYYKIEGGNDTQDMIFCLSMDEIVTYYDFNIWYDNYRYGFSMDLIIPPTEYAKKQGRSSYIMTERDYTGSFSSYGYTSDCIGREGALWWLRTPGISSKYVCYTLANGAATYGFFSGCLIDSEDGGVRPALYIEQ